LVVAPAGSTHFAETLCWLIARIQRATPKLPVPRPFPSVTNWAS
jgi:hypothetical protein